MSRLNATEKALVGRMAADLVRCAVVDNETDAVRLLSWRGFAPKQIATYAGDALDLARARVKGSA
jgi:hypothetical protein